MKKALKEFFAANPEATEAHTALGYVFSTIDAAQAMLAGVSDHAVKTYTKEQFEAMSKTEAPKSKAVDLAKVLEIFKKAKPEAFAALIEGQEKRIAKKEAGLKAAADAEKAQADLDAHKQLLSDMKAHLTSLAAPAVTEGTTEGQQGSSSSEEGNDTDASK